MSKNKSRPKYRSRMSAAIHETAAGLHRVGLVDKGTMREFDASCLTAVEPLSARQIVAIRKQAGVSQGVFAHYLNVKPKLVSEWERGEKRPSGPSLKLLSIVKTRDLTRSRDIHRYFAIATGSLNNSVTLPDRMRSPSAPSPRMSLTNSRTISRLRISCG